MTNVTHLLATALLLLASFIVGAIVGTLFRKLVSALTRSRPKPVAESAMQPPEPEAEQTSPPLFEAPVVSEQDEIVEQVSSVAAAEPAVDDARLAEPTLAPAERVRDTRSFVVRPMPTLPPLTPVSRPAFGSFAPARKPGETVHGRSFWSPFAPPSQPAVAARPSTPFATARIIPFPSSPRSGQSVTAPPEEEASLKAVTEELEALLSDAPVPASADSAVLEPEIVLDAWSAADIEPESVPVAPALQEDARPEVADVAEDEAVVAADRSPPSAPTVEMSGEAQEIQLLPQEIAVAEDVAEAPPLVADLAGLPLELESQLADAIGVSLTLDAVTDAPSVVEVPREATAAPAIALAAYDIAADGGNPDVPSTLAHTILLIADLPPELQEPVAADELPPESAPSDDLTNDASGDDPLELDVERAEPDAAADSEPETAMPIQVAEAPGEPVAPPPPETEALSTEALPTEALVDEDEKRLTADAEAEAEAAAMLAIEGRASPRHATYRVPTPTVPVDATISDSAKPNEATAAVQASAAAVAAAARAAAAVIAENAADRPAGLSAPRHGLPDDLTHVIGILPVIEQALNRIGVYHFDQIAEWTPANIAWVEAHLGLEGRVGRELWRLQAQELASLSPRRELGS